MRRTELGRGLGLAPEAGDGELRLGAVLAREHLRADQLDRRGAGQHAVGGPVDLAHAAAAEQLAQPVAAQLPLPAHLLPEPGHHAGDHHRDAHQQVVGVVHQQARCATEPKW